MAPPQVREVDCRSALNAVTGMPFRWSLNPYRGCTHGCHYCYARATHTYLDLNADDDFTGILMAKRNVAEVLRRELSARTWHHELVAVGSATDVYQPLEGRMRLTRACLEALCAFRTPFTVTTKGPLVVRDIDLLGQGADSVAVSVPTVDVDLWRRLEPGTAHPLQRLRAVARLREAGVNAGVLCAPIIPGLTDSMQHLAAVARAAADHDAAFLAGNTLYLKPGTREHFLAFLGESYPHLVPTYRGLYGSAYLPRWRKERVMDDLSAVREAQGLSRGRWRMQEAKQLALPLD
ncbi:MAG TPA: radical SAM protein [Bacillota bacterium]|nr:radical SAM protein [Bacillota bacterium]